MAKTRLTASNKVKVPVHPLCVDLDNTLIKTDSLYEMLLALIKTNPRALGQVPLAMLRGKAYLKKFVLSQCPLAVETMPVNIAVVEYAKQASNTGRTVVLVTGANQLLAERVQRHFPFFHEAHGSSEQINLTGSRKAMFLIQRFGKNNFDYMGDSDVDFKVWAEAKGGVVVSHKPNFISKVKSTFSDKPMEVIPIHKNSFRSLVKMVRPGQWAKNSLVFVPLVLSHQWNSPDLLGINILAFVAFSALASFVYVLNDLLDLENDRRHPTKKHRPVASGDVSIEAGVLTALILGTLALGVTLFLPADYAYWAAAYIVLNLAYNLHFKKVFVLDAFVLASFYSLRILAGSAAISVEVSHWLIIFSTFFFLSLGFLKRYSDLLFVAEKTTETKLSGRSYSQADQNLLMTAGVVSGFVSILVFALYIYGAESLHFYSQPKFLWGVLFCMLYWITKIWFNGSHGRVQDDPVKFALRDRESLFLGLLTLIFLALAV